MSRLQYDETVCAWKRAVACNARRLLYRNGLSITDVCRAARVSPSTLRRFLCGQHIPATSSLVRLCRVLGITPWDFMRPHWAGPPKPLELCEVDESVRKPARDRYQTMQE